MQLDANLKHPDVVAEPEKRPKWAHTTLQDARNCIGDPTDTRRIVTRKISLWLG
jgi:hypothetical protein